jgi:hypothetical protein
MIDPRRKREREELKGKASEEVCEPCDCVRHHCSHRIPIYRRGSGVELTPDTILWAAGEPRIAQEREQRSTGAEALSNLYLPKLGKSWVCSLLSMCACILRGVECCSTQPPSIKEVRVVHNCNDKNFLSLNRNIELIYPCA